MNELNRVQSNADNISTSTPIDEKGGEDEKVVEGEYVDEQKDVNETGEEQEVHRALSPAQISMIAIGGSIG